MCLERPLFQPVLLLFFAIFDLEWKEKSSVTLRQAKQCWISLRDWGQRRNLVLRMHHPSARTFCKLSCFPAVSVSILLRKSFFRTEVSLNLFQ